MRDRRNLRKTPSVEGVVAEWRNTLILQPEISGRQCLRPSTAPTLGARGVGIE